MQVCLIWIKCTGVNHTVSGSTTDWSHDYVARREAVIMTIPLEAPRELTQPVQFLLVVVTAMSSELQAVGETRYQLLLHRFEGGVTLRWSCCWV